TRQPGALRRCDQRVYNRAPPVGRHRSRSTHSGKGGTAGYTAARLLGASQSLARLQMQAKHGFVRPVSFADEYAQLGRREESIAWLERAFADGDVTLATINCNPAYALLWTDPRFQDLRRRMGLR